MMAIVGRQNAGKTTLLVALAAEFARRKLRVMTLKQGTHTPDLDHKGWDSWQRVLLEAPGERILFERTATEGDPFALAQQYLDGADVVLVEGFTQARIPKIE